MLRDAGNEVRIYQMGPNPHSHEILVVHLPRQKIVYQVDFLNESEYARNRSTEAFLKWMRDKKLKVSTITSSHGQSVRPD